MLQSVTFPSVRWCHQSSAGRRKHFVSLSSSSDQNATSWARHIMRGYNRYHGPFTRGLVHLGQFQIRTKPAHLTACNTLLVQLWEEIWQLGTIVSSMVKPAVADSRRMPGSANLSSLVSWYIIFSPNLSRSTGERRPNKDSSVCSPLPIDLCELSALACLKN